MFGSDLDSAQLLQALYETLYMVSIALFLGAVIGIPLGVLLVITRKQGIWPNIVIHQVLNPIINILRSLPFIILLIAIVPFHKISSRYFHWYDCCHRAFNSICGTLHCKTC